MRVEVEPDAGRGPLLVKRASDPDEVERIRAEATVLDEARHPGIVRVVAHRSDGTTAELCTRWVGAHSLASTAAQRPAEAATTIAAIADAVAHLHRMGLAHNRLTPDHVVLDRDGRPVVCGLRGAGPAARGAPDDVAALGRLLHHLLGAARPHDELEPIPTHRLLRPAMPWLGYQYRSLQLLADQAQADSTAARPTAAEFAAAVRETMARQLPRRPSRPIALVTAGLLAIAVSLGGLEPVGSPPRATLAPAPQAQTPSVAVSTTVIAPTTRSAAKPPLHCTAGPAVDLDLDRDGCQDRVTVAAGRVHVGGRTWVVGEPTDVVLVGDWRCRRAATPALLRRATGDVFVFAGWASTGRRVTAHATRRVVGATGLARLDGPAGCPVLAIEVATAPPVTITPGSIR